MNKVRWGIIGPGKIANRFADGLKETTTGKLVAIASKSNERRKTFGDKYSINLSLRFEDYEEIIKSTEVDAIYISTPHTFHGEWTIKAAKKGKHILCEKPACINYLEAKKVIDVVRNADVFYMEGFMYRCHPQITKLLELIKLNLVGKIESIYSSFGFNAGIVDPQSRLFDKNLAGGAILDVGLYPVSFSRLVAGASLGKNSINPHKIHGSAIIGKTGVDETAYASLYFENSIVAKVETSIRKNMDNIGLIKGTNGSILVTNLWQPGKEGGPYKSSIIIKSEKENKKIILEGPEHLFFFEANLASKLIIGNKREASPPAMTWEDTLGNLKVLDSWRKQIGYELSFDNIK